ncbi:MAG: phosphonate C-P lyase system protein PhnH [Spirulinaceae cyanobacterium]
MLIQSSGFKNPVYDAQQTFRALLNALAKPGKPQNITAQLQPPTELNSACAAACLTLFDLEIKVWLSPQFGKTVKQWLLFHTGCRWTDDINKADFAIFPNLETCINLDRAHRGTAEEPETSTTVLIQVLAFQGEAITLKGPGILDYLDLNFLTSSFWQKWQSFQDYPLGIDGYFFTSGQVMGIPRTTEIMMKSLSRET